MNTNYFLNAVAGNVFGTKTTPELPSQFWLGVSTTLPNVSGGNVTEPSGNAYSRIDISSYLGQPSNGVVKNTSPIYFEEATGSWGVIPYYVIYDSETSGNLLMYGTLSSPVTVVESTTLWIKANNLTLSVYSS